MAKSNKMSKRRFARNFVSKMVKGRNLMTKSGIKKEYNGWSNYETWGFMLIWSNDYGYANFAEEIKSECANMDELKERVRQEVEMVLDDVQEYINGGNQFVQQLCINATEEVDVDECVESICDGIEFDEDEDYEASTKKSQKATKMAKRQPIKKDDYSDEQLEEMSNNARIDLESCRMVENADEDGSDGAYFVFTVQLTDTDYTNMSYEDEVNDLMVDMQSYGWESITNYDDPDEDGVVTMAVDIDEAFEQWKKSPQYADFNASTKKSKGGKMAKGKAVKKAKYENLEDYSSLAITNPISNFESDSRILVAFFDMDFIDIDEIYDRINECRKDLEQIEGGIPELEELVTMGKSTKKSKLKRMNKALAKLGGFTKEDEDEEESEEEEEAEVIVDEEESEDESEKGCKSRKSLRTSKKRMKMRKAEEMPEDADDQQDINQKGSGNAGSELPEDADDVKDVNEKGSGSAGADLPEDADDAEDQKQARARKQLMRSRKNVRKFSVTPGGSPNQESYIDRYNQAPTVRRAIDNHFGSNANKSFDEAQMLQDRIDAMAKSRRNSDGNNVPMRIRKR